MFTEKCYFIITLETQGTTFVHEGGGGVGDGEGGPHSPACTLSDLGPLWGCPTAGLGPILQGSWTSLSQSGIPGT